MEPLCHEPSPSMVSATPQRHGYTGIDISVDTLGLCVLRGRQGLAMFYEWELTHSLHATIPRKGEQMGDAKVGRPSPFPIVSLNSPK